METDELKLSSAELVETKRMDVIVEAMNRAADNLISIRDELGLSKPEIGHVLARLAESFNENFPEDKKG